MTLIDTHAHLYDEKFDDDRIDVIARAREAGVAKIISMGDTMPASAQVVQDAEEHPALYAAVGIHPESACVLTDEMRRQLLTWAQHPKVVAIGEIGLDYYWEKDASRRALQRELFAAQLNLAREAGLPVCIHDREAHGDTLAMLRAEGAGLTGVLHCYSARLRQTNSSSRRTAPTSLPSPCAASAMSLPMSRISPPRSPRSAARPSRTSHAIRQRTQSGSIRS